MKDQKKNSFPEADEVRSGLNAQVPENNLVNSSGELERLRGELRKITGERDKLTDELEKIRFRGEIDQLALHYRFADPDYLEFLCRQRAISPGDDPNIEAMMEQLRVQSPKLFRMEIQSGLPRRVESQDKETNSPIRSGRGADELIQMLQDAPDLN